MVDKQWVIHKVTAVMIALRYAVLQRQLCSMESLLIISYFSITKSALFTWALHLT